MIGKDNYDFERRVDGFFIRCEWLLLRVLVFACFVLEIGRFGFWLLR
jgi:hypothetical protein